MIRNMLNATTSPNQTYRDKLMSVGGGMLLLRKGLLTPGLIGVASLAVGAYAIYRVSKAYSDRHTNGDTVTDMPDSKNHPAANE